MTLTFFAGVIVIATGASDDENIAFLVACSASHRKFLTERPTNAIHCQFNNLS